jgi:hypothetical protein
MKWKPTSHQLSAKMNNTTFLANRHHTDQPSFFQKPPKAELRPSNPRKGGQRFLCASLSKDPSIIEEVFFFFLMHIYRFPAFEISSEVAEKTLGKMRIFLAGRASKRSSETLLKQQRAHESARKGFETLSDAMDRLPGHRD